MAPAPALQSESEKKPTKKQRKQQNSRRQKIGEDGKPYVRSADRRPASGQGGSNAVKGKNQAKGRNRQQQVPQNKSPEVKRLKSVLPMPEFVAPPEAPDKKRFCDFSLAPEVLAATQSLGFQYCTKIQELALPPVLEGKDLAGKAQTGTGKTAAFLASTITRLLKTPPPADRKPGSCRVLVLAPTRELAIQIHSDAEGLAQYTHLNNLVIFGGMDHKGQREALNEPVDILIGTPGRIIDYSGSGHLDLSHTETLIIDEADRMLDMGFIPDVRRIVSRLPRTGTRQTLLFSATLEPEVLRLVDSWLRDPVSVEIEPEHVITDLIDQHFYAVLEEQKLALLLYLIRTLNPERMLIFGNMKHRNRDLVRHLYAYGVDAELLSGDVPQEKRLKVLDRFRSAKTKILVATDVAARGIHVDGISHVLNYDLPEQADDYVHRVGRTGRAGEKGQSISFVCEVGAFYLPAIEKYAGMEIHTIQPEPEMLVLPEKVRKEPPAPHESDSYRGHGGGSRHGSSGHGGGRRH